jgi:predicted DCC family thiol-disulfide oxidoreductase YuxK
MDEQRRMASWHLVASDGAVSSAGGALGPLLRLLPGGRPLAALAEQSPRLSERAYRLVADHRSAFGRAVTSGAKRRADRRIAAREAAVTRSRLRGRESA